jgi:hypothetical protein
MSETPLFDYMRIDRGHGLGDYAILDLFPGLEESPALETISGSRDDSLRLLRKSRIQVRAREGYIFVDVLVPCIAIAYDYYKNGKARDLYFDILHELTHLRQLEEGRNLWDMKTAYVDRETEIEGYAIVMREAIRLGLGREEFLDHLSAPWMSEADVARLVENVRRFLGVPELPLR